MRKVTIQVESIEAGLERFRTAWQTGRQQGEFITFDTLNRVSGSLYAFSVKRSNRVVTGIVLTV